MSTPVLEAITTWRGTVIDVRHISPGQCFTIGADGADLGLQHPALPPTPYTIARIDAAGGARIELCRGLSAAVLTDGRVEHVERPGGLRLLPGCKARVVLDDLALLFAVVPQAPALPPGRPALIDRSGRRALAFAAVVHAALLLVAFSAPVQAGRLAIDRIGFDDRWIVYELTPMVEQSRDDFFTPPTEDPAGETGDPSVDERSVTPPSSTPESSTRTAAAPETVEARKARATAVAEAASQAIDDAFGGVDPVGAEAQAALNGMFGTRDGAQGALAGRASPWGGTGVLPAGAGFDGGPSAGVARQTRGRSSDPSYGRAVARRLPPKEEKVPKVVPQAPQVVGGLDKKEIARVIRRNRGAVQHCYEKALQSRPDIEGKVVMEFVVAQAGRVIATKVLESTLGDASVGACLAARIEGLQFPAVQGGGVVVVRYPFMFRAG